MASVTVTLPDSVVGSTFFAIRWDFAPGSYISLGDTLADTPGQDLLLGWFWLRYSGTLTFVHVEVRLAALQTDPNPAAAGPEFSDDMKNAGTVRCVASDGTSITIPGPNAPGSISSDPVEPYAWTPSNRDAVRTFAVYVRTLADQSLVVTFDDNQNAAPVVSGVSATPNIVNANGTIALSGMATDPDVMPDTLALQWTANPNIGTFSAPTALSTNWTAPGPANNDREIVFTLTATEPDESLTGSASVNVTVRGNRAPVVTASGDQMTVDVGDTVALTGTASDPEGESMTYAWTSDIGGLFSAPSSLSGTWTAPSVTESTVATLTLTANDGVRNGTATVTIIVRPPATQPLTLPAVAAKSSVSGVVVNELFPAATQGLAPYIYSASGLPTGLGFRNRRARGIPVLPGAYTVTYTVTDSNQDMVTRTFTWTITGDIIPQPSGLNVRIDWGDQFYAHAESDVTGRITSGVRCERGRNTGSAILGRSQAGTISFELQNSDGLFDEENPDSDLAGLIRPGIQVQLRNGVTPLWTGVLDRIPTNYAQNGQHRAQVTALGVLSNAIEPEVSGGSLNAESTAQAFIELCDKGDIPYESPQPQPGDAYLMRRWWEQGKLRQALSNVEDTEGGFIFEDREGELGFHLANYRATRTIGTTFVSTTPGAGQLRIVGNPRREIAVKDVHNEVAGDVRQFEQRTGETVHASHDPIPIALGGRLDLVSIFPVGTGALSELDALVAGTDWTANTMPDGSGTNRTSRVDITLELMDFNEAHITIAYPTGGGFDSTLYVRGLTISGTVLTIGTPLRGGADDSVSKQRYRPKTLNLNNTWIRSVADMDARGEAILELIASPEHRVSLDWYVEDWADFLCAGPERQGARGNAHHKLGRIRGRHCAGPSAGLQVNIRATMDLSLIESLPTPPPPPPPPAGDSVTVPLTGFVTSSTNITWEDQCQHWRHLRRRRHCANA